MRTVFTNDKQHPIVSLSCCSSISQCKKCRSIYSYVYWTFWTVVCHEHKNTYDFRLIRLQSHQPVFCINDMLLGIQKTSADCLKLAFFNDCPAIVIYYMYSYALRMVIKTTAMFAIDQPNTDSKHTAIASFSHLLRNPAITSEKWDIPLRSLTVKLFPRHVFFV